LTICWRHSTVRAGADAFSVQGSAFRVLVLVQSSRSELSFSFDENQKENRNPNENENPNSNVNPNANPNAEPER